MLLSTKTCITTWQRDIKVSWRQNTKSFIVCREPTEGLYADMMKQDRQCTYKRNIEARSRNHFCRGKAMSITNYECVSVALVIQHAKLMHRIILSSVACVGLTEFSTLSHKSYDYRKKVTEHKMCVLIYSTNFIWNISHSENNSVHYCHKYT
jgi:hypothetical protein